MEVVLSPQEMVDAACVGAKRRVKAMQRGRSEPHGSPSLDFWIVDIEGAGAEKAVAKALGLYWHSDIRSSLVEAPKDVGFDVQVRWTQHENGHLPVYDRDPGHDRYFLVVGRMPIYRIAGWIHGQEAKSDQYRTVTPRGGEAFWVPQASLRLVTSD